MRLLADLHVHSPYSRATSRELSLESLHLWAQRKGLGLLGTGDITHPAWLGQILEKLEPAEEGLWRLKPEIAALVDREVPESCRGQVRFVLQGEISTIYKKAGRTRKVHHLVLLPDRRSVERLISGLERIGNLRGDGRPILGLDSRDLLELVLDASQQAVLVPAHVWTPWFSVFGSNSGFDDLEECYADLSGHVTALETGLSSDPAMNWRWSKLDRYRLVSNSDAHSASRLGREANILDIQLSFPGLREALVTGEGLLGTVEFFPEEGKYHLDGHRACGVRMEVEETLSRGGLCPQCGRPVTVGVLHRVEELADRDPGHVPSAARPFKRLLPLEEVLGELLGCGPSRGKVQALYHRLLHRWGPEIPLLSELPVERLREASMDLLAEALTRMRDGRVHLEPGFDGQYGVVRLFRKGELANLKGQLSLVDSQAPSSPPSRHRKGPNSALKPTTALAPRPSLQGEIHDQDLDPSQREAVFSEARVLSIVAGPGTGKTRVLTQRVGRLIRSGQASPGQVLAVTFTQRAAEEMAERLTAVVGPELDLEGLRVQTLHAFGLDLIRRYRDRVPLPPGPVLVADPAAKSEALNKALERVALPGRVSENALLERISRWKQGIEDHRCSGAEMGELVRAYDEALRAAGSVDYDDLLTMATEILERHEEVLREERERAKYVFVDEFQDLNPKQVRLVETLLGPRSHLTIIGDPDQCIYGFRGASPEHMARLHHSLQHMETLTLNVNYRSTATIVEAACAVISSNPSLHRRALRPARERGATIRAGIFPSEKAEAIFVAQEIDALLGGTSHWAMLKRDSDGSEKMESMGFGDVAVLSRLQSLLPLLEDVLSEQGIPCERLTRQEHREELIAFHLLEALRFVLDPARGPVPSWASAKVQKSLASASDLRLVTPAQALEWVKDHLPGGGAMGNATTVKRLFESAHTWRGSLQEFLEHWSLVLAEGQPEPPSDKVSLLTVHGAKGLEFRVVFVVGCEEGVFPLAFPGDDREADLQEERRLFYVAVTRARDLLYLTSSTNRFVPGGIKSRGPSRFLKDIPSHLVSHQVSPLGRPRPPRQMSLF